MRDFSISVDIKASPERVWEVLSDGERWRALNRHSSRDGAAT